MQWKAPHGNVGRDLHRTDPKPGAPVFMSTACGQGSTICISRGMQIS